MIRSVLRFAGIVVLFVLAPGTVLAAIPTTERDALIALYGSTNGSGWYHDTNWLGAAGTECSWFGITCDVAETTVTQISLDSNNLQGTIPPILDQLPSLEILDLSGNTLSGTIPSSLGNLSLLQQLRLGYDGTMAGSIPTELGNLSELTYLTLNGHELSGSIPLSILGLSNLEYLYLSHNNLTGGIPPEVSGLSAIKDLQLSYNPLGGTIPAELWLLASLENIGLGYCELDGSIPPAISNLSNLRYLALGGNRLTGVVPPEITTLANLSYVHLSNNAFSGSLPPGLDSMTSLRSLIASNNLFSGPIPEELGDLPEIFNLNLSHNRLTGPIPVELANATALSNIYLSNNRLTGPLPEELGLMADLWRLRIDRNAFVGEIPSIWATLTTLIDGQSDFRYNGLYTPDSSFSTWLDQKQTGTDSWTESQTPPPSDFTFTGQNGVAVWGGFVAHGLVNAPGGFDIEVSGGGITWIGSRVGSKASNSWVVHGLEPGISYAFRARSWTFPHYENNNMVIGEWTDPILTTLDPDPSTLYVATDGHLGNDCLSSGSPCPTISDALALAGGHERIVVAPGTYQENLTIPFSVDIVGAGRDEVTVDAGGLGAVATVYADESNQVRLRGMTLTNGSAPGIQIGGTAVLTMDECRVSNNVAADGAGLKLHNRASAFLDRTIIRDNEASGYGGGIDAVGLLWIEDSEITDNTAAHHGGIAIATPLIPGGLYLDRSTVSGNSCPTDSGGGIRADTQYLGIFNSSIIRNTALMGGGVGALVDRWEMQNSTVSGNFGLEDHAPTGLWLAGTNGELVACTITDNSGPGFATALTTDSTTIASNNIIAGNSPLNCDAPLTSFGFNLEDADSCGFDLSTDLANTPPLLTPLADNGGPTWTHAIAPGSPAMENGDPWTTLATDQRGFPRRYDGDGNGVPNPDIGAFELAPGLVFFDGFESGDTSVWSEAAQ